MLNNENIKVKICNVVHYQEKSNGVEISPKGVSESIKNSIRISRNIKTGLKTYLSQHS